MENVCPKCGGQMDEGTVGASALGLWYRPDNAQTEHRSFRLSSAPSIGVNSARACIACGYLELYIEPRG